MMKLRSYKESFAPRQIVLIDSLIGDLDILGKAPPHWHIYTLELQGCLSVGLLLAAVTVSGTLLELFVRDLNIALRTEQKLDGELIGAFDSELQGDRSATFAVLVDALTPLVITSSDAKAMKEFYQHVRIPFAHGLTIRLSDSESMSGIFDDRDDMGLLMRNHNIEKHLEDEALKEVQLVVRMMVKYRPWLVRRLNG
jgi:hypothetical protein